MTPSLRRLALYCFVGTGFVPISMCTAFGSIPKSGEARNSDVTRFPFDLRASTKASAAACHSGCSGGQTTLKSPNRTMLFILGEPGMKKNMRALVTSSHFQSARRRIGIVCSRRRSVSASGVIEISNGVPANGFNASTICSGLSMSRGASSFSSAKILSFWVRITPSVISWTLSPARNIPPSPNSSPTTPIITKPLQSLYNSRFFQLSESGHSPNRPIVSKIDDAISVNSDERSHHFAPDSSNELKVEIFQANKIAAAVSVASAIAIAIFFTAKAFRDLIRFFRNPPKE
jgi:hypothetical protein